MTDPKGKVLVVIPNYNGGELVLDCIRSVKNQSYSPVEIVIVDNDSEDGSFESIKRDFPDIVAIESGYNAGWGIACNIGMRAAASDYICLLNNDAVMDKDCLAEMVKAIESDAKYGSCASRIMLADATETVEVCGLVIYPDGSSCGRGRLGPAGPYMQPGEVFCANDCCCLYRREMIDDIGDYDPDFFIYCDETEMGWRHQLAGWKCIYTPHAVAYHAHSRSAGSYSAFKAFYVERNRIFIVMKYFTGLQILLSLYYSVARYLTQVYYATVQKRGALAYYRQKHSLAAGLGILIRAHAAALAKLPVMWRRRRSLKKIRRLNGAQVRQLAERFRISVRDMATYE